MLFARWEVRIAKNCGLENAFRGQRPRAAFSRPRSQFFRGVRTHPRYKNSRVLMAVRNGIPMGHFRYIIGFYCLC